MIGDDADDGNGHDDLSGISCSTDLFCFGPHPRHGQGFCEDDSGGVVIMSRPSRDKRSKEMRWRRSLFALSCFPCGLRHVVKNKTMEMMMIWVGTRPP